MRTTSSGALLVIGVSLITLLFAAPADSAPSKTHTILIKGFQFVPERLEVSTGDTIIWKNEDIVPHTATAKKGFDSKGIEKGQSWRFVAKQKGAFQYICTFHPTMKAELVVK
jgi:plastocyanin